MEKRILGKLNGLEERERGKVIDIIEVLHAKQRSKCCLCKRSAILFAEIIENVLILKKEREYLEK